MPPIFIIIMLKIGEFKLHCIVENSFYLDAGGVYGIVPKSIWSKLQQADDKNLLPFDTNVFFLQAHGKNILFDVGLGDFLEDKQRKLYNCYQPSNLLSGLRKLGIEAEQIDYVLLSHLHWDHVGGCLKLENHKPMVVFKNAEHYVHSVEWEDANNPDERTSGVYFPERLKAIKDAGLLRLISEKSEILPGISMRTIGGHTRGQLGIEVESNGQKVIYYGDNFLSCYHLKVPYVSAMDLFPLETQKFKREILPQIADGGWYVAMDHEIENKVVKIIYDGLKYKCQKIVI